MEKQPRTKAQIGKASRSKGGRNERLLVKELERCGWKAKRVPLSGAMQGYKGDVIAEKGARVVNLELKVRANEYKQIYVMYEEYTRAAQDDVMAIVLPGIEKHCLSISSSLDALYEGTDFYTLSTRTDLQAAYKRTLGKLATMERLLEKADILAIRIDQKPFLYLRYR